MVENKIEFIEARESADVKGMLHPIVAEWFFGKFKDFSLTQLYGVAPIHERRNILISAPTGGTKTLTAFLSILNYLVGLALRNELEDKMYAVYVSPLKALSNDIFVNLEKPLAEINELVLVKGLKMQPIRVGLRTGDTTMSERAKMAKRPPHIFVTTPESLAIVLTAPKFSENLRALEFIVVDEIHALANKRGVFLSLMLERLQEFSVITPVRIGLSATIAPLEEIAKFLVGTLKDCLIAKVELVKDIDIGLISPGVDLLTMDGAEDQKRLYNILDELIQQHKTTLIFTNTRNATERIIHYLDDHFPGKYCGLIGAHHSSMSKEQRFMIEERLRKGDLKVAVSSTSLELGIDIGSIDLVVLLRSPKSVSRALQRCLTYDSEVLCVNGKYVKIGEIVEKKLNIEIISYDKDKGFVKNSIAEWKSNGFDETLKIKLECGEEIEGTKEHPILTDNGWKAINELKEGDLIAEVRGNINFNNDREPYLYELLEKDKIFVVNKDNFFQKEIDNYIKNNNIGLRQFSKLSEIPYLRLIDMRRLSGRKKSIRLDYFLKTCEICGVSKERYFEHLRAIKTKGSKWPKWPLKLTGEIMWLAGITATDGCIVKSKDKEGNEYYKIKIGNKSKVMIDKIREIVRTFEIDPYIKFKDGFYNLEFGSNLLTNLFINLGIVCKRKSYDLYVSETIYSLPSDLIYSYLEGIFEGDGNLNIVKGKSHGMIRIFSASKQFIFGLHKLISRLGINNKIRKDKIKPSKLIKKVSDGWMYCLQILRKEDLRKFFENIPCFGEKAKRGKELTKDYSPYMSVREEFDKYISYSKILSIENSGRKQVYNLTLEKEPNNFIVGNIITHNCGRAGHQLHANPKGRFVVMDRDDLVECAVLMKHMKEKIIDRVDIPVNALDVLAQHIYGMAISRIWNIDEMLTLVRKSYCYSTLSKEDFMSVISYLSGDYDLEHRNVYAKIWYDTSTKQVGKRGKLARLIYLTNIGTIPEEGFVSVVINSPVETKGSTVGSIDEAFLEKLRKGDVFVLGGAKYQFIHSKGMKAYVIANVSRQPTIPSWFSEQLPLSYDVALAISKFRGLVSERVSNSIECVKFIKDYTYCSGEAAGQIYRYCLEQRDFSALPTDKKLIVEQFKQEKEYLLFHSLYGRRVNDALSRAYGFVAAQLKHRDVEIGINDNGFFISGENLDVNKILKGVTSVNLRKILDEAINKTDVLRRRFRHCAARSLMILRNYKGRSKSVGKQQMHSHFLLSAVNELSKDFPILREARREVLNDLMDINHAEEILKKIERKDIEISIVRTPLVSPFGLNLLTQSHSDFIKVEDRINFLKRMHELHLKVIESR
ncbi:MAG: DEAD/DEAH box helicase [Nanoarchaeota archaeon]